jgi:hypothetical protein
MEGKNVLIIYCGYRGTYGAYLMAAIHTGIYKQNSFPNHETIRAHMDFCRLYGQQYGNLIYVGLDEELREIYVLGYKKYYPVIFRAQNYIKDILHINEELHYVDVKYIEGILPRILALLFYYGIDGLFLDRLFFHWIKGVYVPAFKMVSQIKKKLGVGNKG